MARPLRIEYPGAVYHVISRGNGRNDIYKDDQDRQNFLSILGSVVKRYNWLCHAYCLMANHYHLLVETPDANLSAGMRQLNGVYTQKYNRKHQRPGHIFQGRFKAILIQKENYLLELCRYVVLNPVRAESVKKAEDWRWSSYRATAGINKEPEYLTTDWILGLFNNRKKIAQKRYKAFVGKGIKQNTSGNSPQSQIVLGEETFLENFKEVLENKKRVKEIPRSQRYIGRPDLSHIFKGPETNDQRNACIYRAHLDQGYTMKEIAAHLGIHYTTVSKVIAKKETLKK
jgi:REP element-mobilizing transposase RayT